jgi:hypothetical protein
MKTCSKCKRAKPAYAFHASSSTRDKLHTVCKKCRCLYVQAGRGKDPKVAGNQKRLAHLVALANEGLRKCARCGVILPLDRFEKAPHSALGRGYYCRACASARQQIRRRLLPLAERQQAAWLRNEARRTIIVDAPEVKDWRLILRNDVCAYCGDKCEHIDHIVPISNGALTEWQNLTASCAFCNQSKHDKSLLLYMLA